MAIKFESDKDFEDFMEVFNKIDSLSEFLSEIGQSDDMPAIIVFKILKAQTMTTKIILQLQRYTFPYLREQEEKLLKEVAELEKDLDDEKRASILDALKKNLTKSKAI